MINRIDLGTIPDSPGSYQFKDQDGRVIYVGKAKSLRSRLQNYFAPIESLHPRVAAMVTAAVDVEWITVSNDVEALMLEFSLIKKFRPRFNVRLRDDKSYPYLMVTADQLWPRAVITRSPHRKGARYFGPYPHTYAIRETLDLLIRTFPIRTCSDSKFQRAAKVKKPCLLYHIERCSGPCVNLVSDREYAEIVSNFESILKGNSKSFVDRLRADMTKAASELDFESAARLRDRLGALERAVERQEMVGNPNDNFDVIGLCFDELECQVDVLVVRAGRVSGRRSTTVDRVEELSEDELLEVLIEQLYFDSPAELPKELIVPFVPTNTEIIEDWLCELRGNLVSIRVARRGHKKALLDRANANASESFRRHRLKRASDHNARSRALTALADELSLPIFPLRIECYDMSHLSGTNYVGSMVVMEDGLPKKSEYRRFKVSIEQNDDFAAMYEVLTRRLRRLNDANDDAMVDDSKRARFSYPPSLMVIDGGKGQLSMAYKALCEAGLQDEIPVISLAKKFEEVYRPNESEPIRIPRTSESLFLLQSIRDEAHRFAISFHRQLRDKEMTQSILDDVRGLGPIRKKRLLNEYGSIKKLRTASLEELSNLRWLPGEVGAAVYSTLHDLPS
ncbi:MULTISPECIES: excinuclease ABC subunit UvrC [Acidithrix]|uniref:UvrABC system protein C n=1 Tax=Acidithrix ferrooxidans TaxID=1280514 RepID=A0A0D8HMB4_9ACTN|nr:MULTISPECIES: excinuclease ABC subunit UvrC [Acidithrix]KJF18246.1 UvrABC system protein C [Acidithrix ferrooxidans]CAG4923546.1 unnamed protein product [Acidithrix sp. C25]